jgi:hypothetical protein
MTQADPREWLISKFPDFDPSWPKETQTSWFNGFQEFIKIIRIHESKTTEDFPQTTMQTRSTLTDGARYLIGHYSFEDGRQIDVYMPKPLTVQEFDLFLDYLADMKRDCFLNDRTVPRFVHVTPSVDSLKSKQPDNTFSCYHSKVFPIS